jgi:nucleoside-diphosphate-sugar epimerase
VLAELTQRGVPALAVLRPTGDARRLASLARLETVRSERLDDPALGQRLRAWRPTVLIHSAWHGVNGQDRNELFQVTENLPLTAAAVELAREAGCSSWIGFGSQAEYGNQNRILDESAPTHPTTLYGKAKLAAGIAAMGLCEAAALCGTWLRVFSLYGQGDDSRCFVPHVIGEFLHGRAPKVTRCEQRWDYLNVTDAAHAVVAVVEKGASGVFNLGSGIAVPLRQVVEEIRHIIGTPVEPEYGAVAYRPDQVMHLQADIAKLSQAVGWAPSVSLHDGLRECVSTIRQQDGRRP